MWQQYWCQKSLNQHLLGSIETNINNVKTFYRFLALVGMFMDKKRVGLLSELRSEGWMDGGRERGREEGVTCLDFVLVNKWITLDPPT